jgi:uncharacterized protein (DUF58 family)
MPEVTQRYRFLVPEAVGRLRNMNLIARTVVEGFIAGLHRSPHHGFSVEFSDHRQYTPGDNLRDLDWLALARTDKYYIKRYEEETNLRAYLLLDTSGSMGYRSGENVTKMEYGCYLAASLAYLMVRQQDSVGLVTFDRQIRSNIPARSTTAHLNLLLRHLETLRPGEVTSVSRTFHDLAEMIKRRGLIIIISDLYDDEREVMRALRHFRHKRHEVILFHVFDRAELDFPFRRLSDFVDLETNQRLQIDPRYVRAEYLRQIRAFVDAYKRACSESQIEYVNTDTSVPYDFMLSAYLAKRKHLG